MILTVRTFFKVKWEILLGGRMSEFSAGGGGLWGLPHPPSGENPVLKRPGNPVIRKI